MEEITLQDLQSKLADNPLDSIDLESIRHGKKSFCEKNPDSSEDREMDMIYKGVKDIKEMLDKIFSKTSLKFINKVKATAIKLSGLKRIEEENQVSSKLSKPQSIIIKENKSARMIEEDLPEDSSLPDPVPFSQPGSSKELSNSLSHSNPREGSPELVPTMRRRSKLVSRGETPKKGSRPLSRVHLQRRDPIQQQSLDDADQQPVRQAESHLRKARERLT